MTEPIYKRQPILVGCLGCLSVSVLAMCGAGLFMGFGMKSCADSVGKQLGLDSFTGTFADSFSAGFNMQINVAAGSAEIRMTPTAPRPVTCDDLQAVIFPHLTGTLATVTMLSESHEPGPDGRVQPVPITCRWTGFPNKDTPTGSGVAVPPPSPTSTTPASSQDAPVEAVEVPGDPEAASPAPAGSSGD